MSHCEFQFAILDCQKFPKKLKNLIKYQNEIFVLKIEFHTTFQGIKFTKYENWSHKVSIFRK